jgi:hypothetical protein
MALTTLAAPVELVVERLRGTSRRRAIAVIVVAVLVVAALATYAVQYRQARAELDRRRTELAAAESDLAATGAAIDDTHAGIGQAESSSALVTGNTDQAVSDRDSLIAAANQAMLDAASADASREQTDLARLEIAADAEETQSCFDGVAAAVAANRSGDGRSAVDALQNASEACIHTLAYATGAVFPYDFADPFVLRAGGAYYGYSTNAGAGDIQVIRSTDLVHWDLVGNALDGLPEWASPNATWAPSVLAVDGGYVAYYTVKERSSGLQCISRAGSTSPSGPFHDRSRGPLVCQRGESGSIDPSPVVDAEGKPHLLWKSEGRGGRWPATIWSQPLRTDGLSLAGRPHALLHADRGFENGVIEGPTMVRSGGGYLLLYAAAGWSSSGYVTAYASCFDVSGPCAKPSENRLLRSGATLAGPGGAEIFRAADGSPWVAFHAYTAPNIGYPASRYLHMAPLRVTGSSISIDTPT